MENLVIYKMQPFACCSRWCPPPGKTEKIGAVNMVIYEMKAVESRTRFVLPRLLAKGGQNPPPCLHPHGAEGRHFGLPGVSKCSMGQAGDIRIIRG